MQLYLPANFGQLEFHIFHFRKETLQCYFVRKVENESNLNRKIEIEISLQLLSIPQKPFGSSRLRFMHHFGEKDDLFPVKKSLIFISTKKTDIYFLGNDSHEIKLSISVFFSALQRGISAFRFSGRSPKIRLEFLR